MFYSLKDDTYGGTSLEDSLRYEYKGDKGKLDIDGIRIAGDVAAFMRMDSHIDKSSEHTDSTLSFMQTIVMCMKQSINIDTLLTTDGTDVSDYVKTHDPHPNATFQQLTLPTDRQDPISLTERLWDQDMQCFITLNPFHAGYLQNKIFLFSSIVTPICIPTCSSVFRLICNHPTLPSFWHYPVVEHLRLKRYTSGTYHMKLASAASSRKVISYEDARSLLFRYDFNGYDISVGVEDVVLDVADASLYKLIPTCVEALLCMYMTKKDIETNGKYTRLLLLDITVGCRDRIRRPDSNGLAEWIRVIQGSIDIYAVPCTTHNLAVFQQYYTDKVRMTAEEILQQLQYVFKNVLLQGDVIVLPPHFIYFEITRQSSFIVRGEFFTGSACFNNMIYTDLALMSWRRSNFMMVYTGLGNWITDFIRVSPHIKSIMGIDVFELAYYVYRILMSIPKSDLPLYFDHNLSKQIQTAKLDSYIIKHNSIASCIDSLRMACHLLFTWHNQRYHESMMWIKSTTLPEELVSIDSRIASDMLSFDLSSNGDNRIRFVLFNDKLHVVDMKKIHESLIRHGEASICESSGEEINQASIFPSILSEASLTQYPYDSLEKYCLNVSHFLGFIGDFQISLLNLFRIVHIDTTHPARKMAIFLHDFTDPIRREFFRHSPDVLMNFQVPNEKLNDQTLLSVDEILGYLYAIARPSDISMFYKFARFSLHHNKNAMGPKHMDYYLICPIKIIRWGCDDEWIHGFLHTCHYDDFMKEFAKMTRTFDHALKAFSADTPKGVIVRKFCLICTKMVLIIMRSDDGQLMVVKFHICSHPLK